LGWTSLPIARTCPKAWRTRPRIEGKGSTHQVFGILPKPPDVHWLPARDRTDGLREALPKPIFQEPAQGGPLPASS
jgi:hypothetical protein